MAEDECLTCGRPLPARPAGRRGRASRYCSAACRQKAYRSRTAPATEGAVHELIDDIRKRAEGLAPRLPGAFYTEVSALSSAVGRLRRIARAARDAAQAEETRNVTPEPVTELGDEWGFAGLVEPYRRELQVHCYRMVGSYDDSEDMVQETFLRAWRHRDTFEGRSSFRAWLYRIATNTCLDFLRRTQRRPQRYEAVPGMAPDDVPPPPRIAWLQPYPDEMLADLASPEAGPDAAVVSRETIELVFLTAIQHLPPRQRAVLIMRDVLDWPAADTASLLDMSVASVNSALQRARPALRRHLPERRAEWAPTAEPSRAERELLRRYMAAAAHADADAMAELLAEDATLTMPPNPMWFHGRDRIVAFVRQSFDRTSPRYLGRWRSLPTRANGMPAVAHYVQRVGTTVYRAQVLDVLRIEDGRVAEITAFEPHLFSAFGLPPTL
ncbi:MAG: sigma-70 family RNA polymerase sigma factor [Mycobacteriales bacterium]